MGTVDRRGDPPSRQGVMPNSENAQTHRRAVHAVLEELERRGFSHLAYRGQRGEHVVVTGKDSRVFRRVVEVHGGTVPPMGPIEYFLAGPQPPDDPDHFVVCVDLRHPFLPGFYVMTNAEARDQWDEQQGAEFWIGSDVPRDSERFELLAPVVHAE